MSAAAGTVNAYSESTQLRFWTFTPEALAAQRAQRHEARVASASGSSSGTPGPKPVAAVSPATLSTTSHVLDAVTPSSGLKRPRATPGPAEGAARDDAALPSDEALAGPAKRSRGVAQGPLSLAEEQRLLHAEECSILAACQSMGFDRLIGSTAATFFKRFFLSASPAQYPPGDIKWAAIFLAIKTEACPYTEVPTLVAQLKREQGLSDRTLIGREVALLHGLRYHLSLYHAYRPAKAALLHAISAYLSQPLTASGSGGRSLDPHTDALAFRAGWDTLQEVTMRVIDVAAATDAPLIAPPSLVAAAAVIVACQAVAAALAGASPSTSLPPHHVAATREVGAFLEGFIRSQVLTHGGGTVGLTVPPVALPAFLERLVAMLGAVAAASSVAGSVSGGAAFLPAPAGVTPAEALELEARLVAHLDPAYVEGTPEFEARVAAAAAARAAYQAEKAAAAAAVAIGAK